MAKQSRPTKLIPWLYDFLLWLMSILIDCFFRELHPRGSWRVPKRGPVLFVAAPHANQFVDPLILMRILRTEAKRRIATVIAAKSMDRKFIGTVAGWVGAIPVGRALDLAKPAKGTIYLPRPSKEPLLLKGIGTDFEKQAVVGGLVILPTLNGNTATADIAEIVGPEEIRLKRPFQGADALKQLTGNRDTSDTDNLRLADGYNGIRFKTAPKVDQSQAFDAVFHSLNDGDCVCIFPEGGSHDRTELLPLKPGVAIMALGALAANPNSDLKIVCCGMNYFHAHKFRSRAVVEFGTPIEVPKDLVELYQSGDRREATRQLLQIIYNGLLAVTITTPNYDSLMLIQAVRRLYKPKGTKLPLPTIVELNRRLAQGFELYKNDPRIISLSKDVAAYNKQLWLLGVRDHQVEYAKRSTIVVIFTLLYRLGKIAILAIGTLPGLVLFAPIFIAAKTISIKKSKEALAASTVKLQGKDVMATWKLLVTLGMAPVMYTFDVCVLAYWNHYNHVQGYVPEWVPLWLLVIAGYAVFISVTFAALRIGEVGMDIIKSLRPLILCLNPSQSNTFVKLRKTREKLTVDVTELINQLGPSIFPDFESTRLVTDPFKTGVLQEPESPIESPYSKNFAFELRRPSYDANGQLDDAVAHGTLPRNESFHDFSNLGIFASRPASRSRSRAASRSGGFGSLNSLTSLSTKDELDEVSKRIRGAMHERGVERTRRRSESSWEFAESGDASGKQTPTKEETKKDA